MELICQLISSVKTGVLSTVVGLEQTQVLEQEVQALLANEAIERIPPSERESRFYSRYFIVTKKDGGLHCIPSYI